MAVKRGVRRNERSHIVFEEDEDEEAVEEVPWSLESYPEPDKRRFGKRKGVEYVTATERLFWRRDQTLAFRVGKEYRADIRDQLMTEEELHAS